MFESNEITAKFGGADPSGGAIAERILKEVSIQARSRARMLSLIDLFDRVGEYHRWGCASTSEWLAAHAGMSQMTAREHVRVASALRRLPAISKVFAAGRLSYSHVRALTRFATEETEASLIEVAGRARVEDLEQMATEHRRGRAATDPTFAHRRRSVRQWHDEGMTVILARLPADEGAVVRRALDHAERSVRVSAETGDVDDECDPDAAPIWERRRADALVLVARDWLSGTSRDQGSSASSIAPPAAVLVHIDASSGAAHIDQGPAIGPKTLERVLCDATLRRVVKTPSRKLEYGRSTSTVSPAQRQAVLAARDRCAWPGCRRRRNLHIHHVRHWADGGPSDPENYAPLCPAHHRLVHEGGFRIRILPDRRLEVWTARGDPLHGGQSPGDGRANSVGESAPPYGRVCVGDRDRGGRRREIVRLSSGRSG